jgi:cell shape-determining protein MreC
MSDYNEYMEYYKKTWEQSLAERNQELESLKAENARFREALERIANQDRVDPNAKYYAREALKGGE